MWPFKQITNWLMVRAIKENKMVKDIVSWFLGSESKKRYITALYVAVRAFLGVAYPELVVPAFVDQLAAAFGIWAFGDALKKLEKK